MPARPAALFALDGAHLPLLFPPDLLTALDAVVEIDPSLVVRDFDDPRVRPLLPGVEILLTGWGCPAISPDVLDALPRLHTLVHTGGTVKRLVSPALWDRGIAVSSAAAANALPVAEYALGMILLVGKGILTLREEYRAALTPPPNLLRRDLGNLGRRVGIVGASKIGRRVMRLLRPFDFDVLLYDPFVDAAEAKRLGVHPVGLDELLANCSITSLHAPATPATRQLVTAERLALMPDGATLINTARGSLVDTEALTEELVSGRINAILDVTDPDPLPATSPLFRLPNAFLTPHVAGSQGNELRRLGLAALREVQRAVRGEPLAHRVEPAELAHSA
ncbi:hydroxyacid dehydrogenase [Streptomyces sp. 3MP-14]|uniref:Hydroxyacid dehydrogenase n=1 Tax=Streptomyces mimosae TaxID=2586635 RepID=A0A5N6ACN2_9ACTN|nr:MULTISPECIES: hydroxyacid dehydrogenase [Streptomyces]KAB8165696.1 hydroxyacid dehydrogenase [Streptomyces mimosae]KAB8176085.1 hydroxyacid dehydrogenase [Streptomyces sp. 3MP-14]